MAIGHRLPIATTLYDPWRKFAPRFFRGTSESTRITPLFFRQILPFLTSKFHRKGNLFSILLSLALGWTSKCREKNARKYLTVKSGKMSAQADGLAIVLGNVKTHYLSNNFSHKPRRYRRSFPRLTCPISDTFSDRFKTPSWYFV